MSSMFSPRAGKQATGVEGVRAYYLVVSAWPVPTYLDCKCSSCACCEYLSCDVIGRRGHPAPGAHKGPRSAFHTAVFTGQVSWDCAKKVSWVTCSGWPVRARV
jgi:hypothetical protein